MRINIEQSAKVSSQVHKWSRANKTSGRAWRFEAPDDAGELRVFLEEMIILVAA